MKFLLVIVLVSLIQSTFAQSSTKLKQYSELDSIEKIRVDSLIYSRIRFNALKAKEDIKNDTIRIVRLRTRGTLVGTPVSTYEEILKLEKRFGFIYYYEYLPLPDQHLKLKEEEYNKVVYQYLDSIFRFNTQKEVFSEMRRMWWERTMVFNRTDKELRKYIKKTLKGEDKEIKNQVFEIDKLYRDKKFKEAIAGYIEICSQSMTNLTTNYILNSIYYCHLNMLQFEKADDFRKQSLQNTNHIKK